MAASKRFEKLNTISLNLFRKAKTNNISFAASPKQTDKPIFSFVIQSQTKFWNGNSSDSRRKLAKEAQLIWLR